MQCSMYKVTFSFFFTEPMSTASSHQYLKEDAEKEEQRENFNFEDEIGKQKGKTTSGEETAKCSEPQTHSSDLKVTQEKHADNLFQAVTTVSPAGQECTSYTSKFLLCHFHTLYSPEISFWITELHLGDPLPFQGNLLL